jgi:hypothetical protein
MYITTTRSAAGAAIAAAAVLLLATAGTASAASWGGFGNSNYATPTWGWNAEVGASTGMCDGGWDTNDSLCMFTRGYAGYGGGGYVNSNQSNRYGDSGNGYHAPAAIGGGFMFGTGTGRWF